MSPERVHRPAHDRTAAAILDAAARVLAEHGAGASIAEVAAAAGVGRATVYRYYASREALLEALASAALRDAGARLADAALDRVPVEEAVARIARALVAVGERYAVLVHEQVPPDPVEAERLLGAPIRAVVERGIADGTLRDDLSTDVLLELLGGVLAAAVNLPSRRGVGLEEAAAAATSLFLRGAARPER